MLRVHVGALAGTLSEGGALPARERRFLGCLQLPLAAVYQAEALSGTFKVGMGSEDKEACCAAYANACQGRHACVLCFANAVSAQSAACTNQASATPPASFGLT